MPNVSVIIPAYNQGHYLGQAIQSVLDQTFEQFEVIVVDDGSTDSTREVVHRFTDSRIHYVYQANRGLSAARNTGLQNAASPYVSFLDSDDLFLPEKLRLLITNVEASPDCGLIAGQAIPIDEQVRPIGEIFVEGLPADGADLLLGNPLHVGSVLVARAWLDRVGPFDEGLRSYEDWDMWLRLARAGCQMGWVAQPVSLYRFHRAQMTRDGRQMTTATFAVLDKIFGDPSLPENWRARHDLAYSNAFLRAAAQAYQTGNLDGAKSSLIEAVRLNSDLATNDYAALADQFAAWTDLPKTRDPLAFLERIYDNLPDNLEDLRKRRQQDLGRAAMALAFDSYQRNDFATARTAAWRAFHYQPTWLINRGAVAVFVRSWLKRTTKVQEVVST